MSATQDASMAEVLELLAIAAREIDKVTDLAKKRGSTVTDVYEASTDLIDAVYNLELVLERDAGEMDADEEEENWED